MKIKNKPSIDFLENINYILLTFAICHILSITTLSIDVFEPIDEFSGLLFLSSVLIPPLILYKDLNQIDDRWTPYFNGGLWVLGSFLPLISPSILITYICRRHEMVKKDGGWAGWPIIISFSIGIMVIAIGIFILFSDSTVEGNTPLVDFSIWLMLTVTYLPGFAAYFDLKYLRSADEHSLSPYYSLLWTPGLMIWFIQYVVFFAWIVWRFKFSSLSTQTQALSNYFDEILSKSNNSPATHNNKDTNHISTDQGEKRASNQFQSQFNSEDTQTVEELYTEAESLIEAAETAEENEAFEEAVDNYTTAKRILEQIDGMGDNLTEKYDALADDVSTVEQRLTDVTEKYKKQLTVSEALKEAERSFQEGIAGYLNEDHTLSRVRFRQARNGFEEVIDLIENNSEALLNQSVTVTPNPQQQLPTSNLKEFSQLTDETIERLEVGNAATVDDISIIDGSIRPGAIESISNSEGVREKEITALTMLSWWDDEESVEFETVADIDRRLEQAKLGFEKS